MTSASPTTGRRLPIWGFILLAVGYLAAVQLFPRLTSPDDAKYATYTDTASIVGGLWVTVGVGSLIGLVAVAVLGWWRPVFVEDRRLPRWTWVFPIILLVTIAAGISYGNLADKGLTYTLMLLVGCLFVGVSEELMFRGIGVTAFRQAGFTEGKVALWTCVLFGLAHATNIFSEGVGALPQVLDCGRRILLLRDPTGVRAVDRVNDHPRAVGFRAVHQHAEYTDRAWCRRLHRDRHPAGDRRDCDDPEGLPAAAQGFPLSRRAASQLA